MSINDGIDKSKPITTVPAEEEFDIVGSGQPTTKPLAWKKHAFMGAIIVFITAISFGIGRLITYENTKPAISVSANTQTLPAEPAAADLGQSPPPEQSVTTSHVATTPKPFSTPVSTLTSGPIVASKNGTKYYLVTCSGAKRISDANKIYFATIDDARAAGLTPSSTCKGLK